VSGRRRPAGIPATESGSATVWVVIVCLVTWSVVTVALSIGGAVVARHRTESAADLAALAGARLLAGGVGDPCAEAQRVAVATRARVVECDRLPDGSLQVVAEVALPRLLARWPELPPARARARSGAVRSVNPAGPNGTGGGRRR
jgi:secretion/DNA translocation related TadE-like protein